MAKVYIDDQHLPTLQNYVIKSRNQLHTILFSLQQMQERSFSMNASVLSTLHKIQQSCNQIQEEISTIDAFIQESASMYQQAETSILTKLANLTLGIDKPLPSLSSTASIFMAHHTSSLFKTYVARSEASSFTGFDLKKALSIFRKESGLSGNYTFDLVGAVLQNQIGKLGMRADLSVGHAEISGKCHIALQEDGVFQPSLMMDVGAKLALAHGIVTMNYDHGWFSANAKASGELGSAEAKGNINISKKGVQIEGEVGVAAAKGKVSGSLEILGIKITATAHGEVGAVGIGGTLKAEDRSFELGAKASCILGGGFNFKVDW